ncbi:MAG: sigma-70 family RNA polymerase sigma factor [Candidatus Solibacter sp.]
MNARSNPIDIMEASPRPFDFEAAFREHYARLARVIARVIRDPARSEELAVEVLWKLWRTPAAHGEQAGGWLYRTAVRTGLNELRSRGRVQRHEQLADATDGGLNPEQAHAAAQQQEQVRAVLAALDSRQAELLLLRGSGLSYAEVAAALELNPSSVGTLLARAQQAFRKEYIERYGEQ